MEIRSLRPSELDQAFELNKDAFHAAADFRKFFLRFVDPSRVIAAFDGGRMLAMTTAIQFGQYFGGRSVPMGGLSAVAVVPDARGRGLAKQVIGVCIAAMRERGEVISSLFPATTSLYRSLGWELGGNYAIRKLVPRQLRGLARPEGGRARPFVESDWQGLRACYDALARGTNGCVDRPGHWWARAETRWQERDVYVFEGADGGIEGYLVYHQVDGEFSALGGEFGIVVDEIVTGTRDAGLGLWGLLGSWWSQVDQVVFHGAADDPILLVLPEQVFEPLAEVRWMTRIVDAEGAVAARGFPSGLEVEVALELRDEGVPANSGRYALTVQRGRGELVPTKNAGGGPMLDARGLSSLYTGWAGTSALARAGLLEGGSADQRAALDAAFTGTTAWIFDYF